MPWRERWKSRYRTFPGRQVIPLAPIDLSAYETALWYVRAYIDDVASARTEAKVRATRAVFWTSFLTGAIALTGVLTALSNWRWMGIVTAVFAGISGTIAAWDHFLGHGHLWRQRSRLLTELQILQEKMQVRRAGVESPEAIAEDSMATLADLLRRGFDDWDSLRRTRPTNLPGN